MRHLINREPEHHTEPPSEDYELGKWHESRGHFEEALKYFKQGAINAIQVNPSSPTEKNGSALSWIEYGRLSARMNKCDEATTSFRQALCFGVPYTSSSLREWAIMLHKQGVNDEDILTRLLAELSTHSIPPSELGNALTEIGAYKEAVHCFNMAEYNDTESGIKHARCLINDGRLNEALTLLTRLQYECTILHWPSEGDRCFINHTIFLCNWRLSGTLPYLPPSDSERIQIAKAALSVGMVTEADYMLSMEGDLEKHNLICMLYTEGYIDLVDSLLKQIVELPRINSTSYSNQLHFIAAERLYDQREYDKASAIFENLRLSQAEHTNARFGEAACYLHSALLSLSSRMTRIESTRTVKEQSLEYMHSINAALHIVENTKWHTSWTPAQKRRKYGLDQSSILN